jgi:hypothetical protein
MVAGTLLCGAGEGSRGKEMVPTGVAGVSAAARKRKEMKGKER